MIKSLDKEFAADPAAYVGKYVPAIDNSLRRARGTNRPEDWQAYFDTSMIYQIKRGAKTSQVRFAPKYLTEELGGMITSLAKSNPAQASREMGMWQAGWGKNYYKVFDEMARDKRIDPDLKSVGILGDQLVRTQMIENFANEKIINEGFKKIQSAEKEMKRDLETLISKEMKDFSAAFSFNPTGKAETLVGIRKQIDLEAKRILLSGNSSVKEAVVSATTKVIGQNFDVVDNVWVLKGMNANLRDVEVFKKANTRAKNLESLDVGIPVSWSQDPAYADLTPEEKKKKYYKWLQTEEAVDWSTSPDGKSLQLFFKENGSPVLDSKGNFIQRPFEDIRLDEATIKEYNKGLFEGLFD